MSVENTKLHVAHTGDLNALNAHWQEAREGTARTVLLTGPLGSGRRALVGELCRKAHAEDSDVLIWRATLSDEEDGLQTLLRIYAGLFNGLHRDPVLRGKVEMALNSQIPNQPKRVQGWYSAFIDGLKKGAPKPSEGNQMQVILPRDNPLIGIVEIANGIARKFPVILDLQNAHNSHSVAIHAMLEGLIAEAEASEEDPLHLLTILSTESVDDTAKAWFPLPLLEMFERREDRLHKLEMPPWGAEDTQAYLDSKGLKSDAAAIAEIAGGRPGFIAELVDLLESRGELDADIGAMTLTGLADATPDADELEAPEPTDDKKAPARKHATSEDGERVAHLSAILGLSFPSGLVADMGGFDRESIDDILDATEGLYKELQYIEGLGTWIYQFHKAILRESVLARHQDEEGKQIAMRVAAFMERFMIPRGYAFMVKTMRILAENGGGGRAALLRSRALGADQPQVWAMVQDLLRYFDENAWPAPMRRTIYMNLLDRLGQSGDTKQAEGLWNEAMAWAQTAEDRPMTGWLLLTGSRMDHRRQDLYRARERAVDALTLFTGLEDQTRMAEATCQLAMIELADGNPDGAIEQATAAEEASAVPAIQAQTAFIRGVVSQRKREWPQAIDHFKKSNEVAGKAGLGPIALDAGFNLGQCLLVSGQHSAAADVLGQITQVSRMMKNPMRERAATSMLAQAQGALKNFEDALGSATRTLELTRSLKLSQMEGVDLYNIGLFNMMLGRPSEALTHFEEARSTVNGGANAAFMKELLFNMGTTQIQAGDKEVGAETLRAALEPATSSKDWRKVVGVNTQLASLEAAKGNADEAKALLTLALKAAETGNLKDERKGIKKKLKSL